MSARPRAACRVQQRTLAGVQTDVCAHLDDVRGGPSRLVHGTSAAGDSRAGGALRWQSSTRRSRQRRWHSPACGRLGHRPGPRFSDAQVERRTQTPPPVLIAVEMCERPCWATSMDPRRQDVRSPQATSIPSCLAVTDCAPWLSAISVGAEGQATCGPVAAKEPDVLAHCGPQWMTNSGSRNADSARIHFLATGPLFGSGCYAPHSEDSSPAGWYGRVRDQTQ